jgi:hypothetical protein
MLERPSFRPFLASTLTLLVLGLGTLALALLGFTPTVWPRWLFFFGCDLALTGLALPAVWFLNLRFPSTPPATESVVVRQAMWVGVYGATLLWLQKDRLVSVWLAFALVLGLGAIEYLIRMRERSRWTPAEPPEAPVAEPHDPRRDA